MMIKKLDATFGKLEGETLELHDGLNVIQAPNESGKSTWCAFIRAMLYGVDSSERQKAGYLPDKMRYAPWSGAPMQGSMEIVNNGSDITLTRTTKTPNAPMREFSAVYTGTNVPVEGLTGSNAGETLTGVGRDVFRRSAFIEQGKIAVTQSAELEKRISAIVSTGDEDVSYSEVDGRLRQWQRRRKYNKRGYLPEIENAMDRKKTLLNELASAEDQREEMNKELADAKNECARIEAEMVSSRKNVRKEALSSLQSVRNEVNAASEKHDKADAERERCRAALLAEPLSERTPDEARAQVKDDIASSLRLKDKAERKGSPALAIVLFVLCAALIVAGIAVQEYLYYGLIAAAVVLIVALLVLRASSRKTAEAQKAADMRQRLLAGYKVENEDDMAAILDKHIELYGKYADAQRAERETAKALAAARRRQEQAESRTLSDLDFTSGDNQSARLTRQLNEARAKCSRISAKIAEKNGRLAAMGDPLVLGSEINELEHERAEIEAEYEAIALAIDTLKSADEEIRSRFSPALGSLAAEYMQFVTGGKYDKVMLGRDFSAMVHPTGDDVSRDATYLSAGALDLMYLAVRLAVCKLAMPEGSNCPLVIDDALVNFDAGRREQTMKLLEKIGEERQVILFSC